MIKDEKYWAWVNRKQYIPEIVDLALSAYFDGGSSVSEISSHLEINPGTLRQWIKDAEKLGFGDRE